MPNEYDVHYGIGPVQSSALENSHVLITPTTAGFSGPFIILSLTALNFDTSTGYIIMLFDAVAVPANGAVTPIYYFPIDPGATGGCSSISVQWQSPGKFSHGIVVAASSTVSTPFTLTLGVSNLLAFEAQITA